MVYSYKAFDVNRPANTIPQLLRGPGSFGSLGSQIDRQDRQDRQNMFEMLTANRALVPYS